MSASEMRKLLESLNVSETTPVSEPEEKVKETKMPAGVIKTKMRYEEMSPKDFHEKMDNLFQERGLNSNEEKENFLKQMAWRHGYGKMSPVYWDKYTKGLLENNFGPFGIEEDDFFGEDFDDDYDADEEHFNWQEEMETGVVIHDNPRGGYNLSAEGRYIDNYPNWDDALAAANEWMRKHQYWPNLFFVNDHGNVTHMDYKGNEINSVV